MACLQQGAFETARFTRDACCVAFLVLEDGACVLHQDWLPGISRENNAYLTEITNDTKKYVARNSIESSELCGSLVGPNTSKEKYFRQIDMQ